MNTERYFIAVCIPNLHMDSETCPVANPVSCTMGNGSYLGVNFCRGVLLATHPF